MIALAWLACATDPVVAPPAVALPEPAPATAPAEQPDGFGRGCSVTNEASCVLWAKEVRHDPVGYRELLGPSCERGYGTACATLALWYEEDRAAPEETIERLFRVGCTLGQPGSCRGLSRYVEGEERQAALTRSCELGDPWACKDLGLPPPPDPPRRR